MTSDAHAALFVLLPAIALLGAALAVLAADWLRIDRSGRRSAGLSLIGTAAAAIALAFLQPPPGGAFGQPSAAPAGPSEVWLLQWDGLAAIVSWVVVIAAAATVAVSLPYTERRRFQQAEYFALVLLAAAAMIVVTAAVDLVTMFLLIETFSLALYVLSAFARGKRPGLEAGLKYFVLGSVAAGFFLYGAALVYASTGAVNLASVHALLAGTVGAAPPLLGLALALLVVGLGFKMALVPFHLWTPDVYEGAPMPVTSFLSAATKAAALAALLRVLWTGFGAGAAQWSQVMAVLAVATMVLGNLAALVQSDLKRMLAYSAIAQAGILVAALVAAPPGGVGAAIYYLLVYALATLGAFATLLAIGPVGAAGREATALDDLRGLGRRHAPLALALSLFLVSLVGLPPTAGFVGKWYVFAALVDGGLTPLAIVVVLNGAISALYYLRPVVYMYAAPPESDRPIDVSLPNAIVVASTAVFIAVAIVLTGPLVEAARRAGAADSFPTAAQADGSGSAPGLFFTAPRFEKGGR